MENIVIDAYELDEIIWRVSPDERIQEIMAEKVSDQEFYLRVFVDLITHPRKRNIV
jgi:hypothetical protein